MKNLKKLMAAVVVAGLIGVTGAAYAASALTPADIAAQLTGKTVTEMNQERADGKTYGTIAKEAGKLEEFKNQMLEQKKTLLNKRVSEGTMTQEQADTILSRINNNQANCDGSASGRMGGSGAGFGQGQGSGQGKGQGNGQGIGKGQSQGQRQGTCNGSGGFQGQGIGQGQS